LGAGSFVAFPEHGVGRTFRWPIVIGLVTAINLAAALLGDGAWDAISWLALAIPLLVIVGCIALRGRTHRGQH
jgi:uncharacterized membrane protein